MIKESNKSFVTQGSLQGEINVRVVDGTPAYISVHVGTQQLFFVEWSRAECLADAIKSAMQDHELEYEAERERIERMTCGADETADLELYSPWDPAERYTTGTEA